MSPSRIAAVVLLLISIVATGMLVFQHFVGAAIPGCAPGGACAQAAASAWGRVPGTNIPVSLVGLAYYIAVLIAYVHARGEVGMLRWMVRLGVLGSLLYMGVMLSNLDEYLCWYCLIGHLGHFGFWGIMEWTTRAAPASMTPAPQPSAPLTLAGGVFAFALALLIGANTVHQRDIERAAQRELEETMRQMDAGGGRTFTGRYVRGPENAAVRVIMFTDYQCPQCKRLKDDLMTILSERDDVSFSIKHYPLDTACNRYVPRPHHRNACWSARVVEAAGILGEADGFWRMHDWVAERSGEFSDAALTYALPQLGFNANRFMDVVRGQETLDRVRADIEEARQLGIMGTPLTFINGVELRGARTQDTVRQAIERAADAAAHADSPEVDHPPSAFEKHVEDWRHGLQAEFPPVTPGRSLGAAEPRIVIDVWGDYHDRTTFEFDAVVRTFFEHRDDVQYNFRFFPLDPSCNPHAPGSGNPYGCVAARAGEAAARLYGAEGYARMHQWLLTSRSGFSDRALRTAVIEMGFDADALLAEMWREEVTELIAREAGGAQETGVRGLPHVFINGRHLPRWRLAGHDVLGTIVEEAAEQAD